MRYLGPDTLEWLGTEMGHSEWVHWTLAGDIDVVLRRPAPARLGGRERRRSPPTRASSADAGPRDADRRALWRRAAGPHPAARGPTSCAAASRSRCSSSARASCTSSSPAPTSRPCPTRCRPPRDRLHLRRRRDRRRARAARPRSRPLGGLVADRAAGRRLPRQREHGGQRGALPGGAGSAPVGPAADPGAADRLGLAGGAARGVNDKGAPPPRGRADAESGREVDRRPRTSRRARPRRRPGPPRPRRGAPPRRARGWRGWRSARARGARRGSRSPRRP